MAVPGQQCPSHQQLHDPARRCRTGGCTGVASISVWISLEETPAQLGSGALHPHETEVFCLIQTELPALHSAPAAPPQGSPSSSHLPAAPAVPSLGQSRAGQQLPTHAGPAAPKEPSAFRATGGHCWLVVNRCWSTVGQKLVNCCSARTPRSFSAEPPSSKFSLCPTWGQQRGQQVGGGRQSPGHPLVMEGWEGGSRVSVDLQCSRGVPRCTKAALGAPAPLCSSELCGNTKE